jgi:hypothetical protein
MKFNKAIVDMLCILELYITYGHAFQVSVSLDHCFNLLGTQP